MSVPRLSAPVRRVCVPAAALLEKSTAPLFLNVSSSRTTPLSPGEAECSMAVSTCSYFALSATAKYRAGGAAMYTPRRAESAYSTSSAVMYIQ